MMKMLKHNWLKFKGKWLSYPIAYFVKYLMRMLLATCRIEIEGLAPFVEMANKASCIIMLWHNRLGIIAEILHKNTPKNKYTAIISKSRDGEPLAIVVNSYRNGKVIRVPHNTRHQALNTVIKSLKNGNETIVITPDGPRGPVYQIKPGILLAARETSAPIIPLTWTATHYWELNTWDKFMIPKPFSTIKVIFGEAVQIDSKMEIEMEMERAASLLQSSLKNC